MKTEYVLGFLFNEDATGVVLIRKGKPTWQVGKLNGVGGKMEPGEQPDAAILREFEEEAGAVTAWQRYCEMGNDDWRVYCFKSFDSEAYQKAMTMTVEAIEKHSPDHLTGQECVSNLHWLIELALDDNGGKKMYTKVHY